MQVSSASSASAGLSLQALRDLFQTQSAESTGQTSPSEGLFSPSQGTSSSSSSSSPPPASSASSGLSSDTMSALLESQESAATGKDFASDLVSDLDSDGDGGLSLTEVGTALGVSDTSEISDAFASLDTDSDGVMTAEELESGLQAMGPPPGGAPSGGAGGAAPASAEETSETVFDAADTNEDGTVSLEELMASLQEDETSSVSDTFTALDTDSDGGLSVDELTSAFKSMMSKQVESYGRLSSEETTGSLMAAA
jgi:Ca2+-binding EF-hand superfamily protein